MEPAAQREAPGPARPGAARMALLLLLLLPAAVGGQEQAQATDWRATLKTIRNGVHKIDTYLNAALDLLGGEDGLCQYKCRDGEGRGDGRGMGGGGARGRTGHGGRGAGRRTGDGGWGTGPEGAHGGWGMGTRRARREGTGCGRGGWTEGVEVDAGRTRRRPLAPENPAPAGVPRL